MFSILFSAFNVHFALQEYSLQYSTYRGLAVEFVGKAENRKESGTRNEFKTM